MKLNTTTHAMHRLAPLGVFALCAGAVAPALAAGSAATVTFTSFTYVVSVGALAWDPAAAFQSLYVQAADGGGLTGFDTSSTTRFDYVASGLTATTVSSSASASSLAGQLVKLTASSARTTGPAFSMPNASYGSASTSGQFTLSQAANVTFLAAYTLTVSGTAGNSADEYAQALASLSVGSTVNPALGGIASEDRFSYNAVSGAATYSGLLAETIFLAANEVGYYNLLGTGSTIAPVVAVPEPATWALMGIGVLLIAGLRGQDRGQWKGLLQRL